MCNRISAFEYLIFRIITSGLFLFVAGPLLNGIAAVPSATFTRLEPLPPPKIVASAVAYPGGRYEATNLLDKRLNTEYSSDAKGTNTFIELEFPAAVPIAAFEHIDRNDPATVFSSELSLLDISGGVIASFPITHVNRRGGVTFFALPSVVTAQRVRWRITGLGARLPTVGGAEITFFTTGKQESTPAGINLHVKALQLLERHAGSGTQRLQIELDYPYAEPVDGRLLLEGAQGQNIHLKPGPQNFEFSVAAVESEKVAKLRLEIAGLTVATRPVALKPVRRLEIFLLPHSHVDIGYTALQADVAKKQNDNLETGLRLARATADYPADARFKWNTEVLWPVDNYLRAATPEKRVAFLAAVKSGQIGLDALYGNTLVGLCRPEELIQLMGYATRLSAQTGVPIESAMISDVPGYTWSTVSAMAQAGVKYFSFAPNYFDRMGGTMKEWQNRPFWWQGPDGRQRVLCWCPSRGYALGHIIGDGEALARFIPDYLTELETNAYPYDITYLRWNVHGDNGSPDEKLSDVVRAWNVRYVYPRLIISTTAAAFREFERRYGEKLPVFSGDYTPYWEDGAASSAFETALNRASGERLVQAETLWAIRNPGPFPAEAFHETWRNILLYSEHTWGAHNSISQPDLPFVRDQWKVKQGFALDADKQSSGLLHRTGILPAGAEAQRVTTSSSSVSKTNKPQFDVFNTSSWLRTDLVTLPPQTSAGRDQVVDERGHVVPSQRLSSGELVFLARDVPPFAAKRFGLQSGACPRGQRVKAEGTRLMHPDFIVRIDERTGAIASWFSRSLNRELVDGKASTALNDFFYLPGSDLKGLQRNGTPRITVKENGPLLASLLIECDAPGCKRLLREILLMDGLDRLEIINTIDKLPVRAKEGLHFGYGFAVPNGTVRMDVGWAVVRPELDQIPAACKNWFSVQRWVDISNDKFGVTWSPVDAPLVEVGGITANLIGSQTDPSVWIQHLEPSQTIYSWVMNNHWHTNYRAEQEGPTVFRFFLRPHKSYRPLEAARFGSACSQPLLVAPATGSVLGKPRLRVSSDQVLVSLLKPSDDGRGCIVRLFGAGGKTEKVKLAWSEPAPRQLWLSDTSEQPKQPLEGPVEVLAWGIVTLRAE